MTFSSLIPFGNRGSLTSRDPLFGDSFIDDTMRRFRRDVDRIFSDFYNEAKVGNTGTSRTTDAVTFVPRVDVREVGNDILVHAELPGVSKENVNVEVRDNSLIISGENKKEEKHETGTGWISERRFGRFQRTIPLPVNVDSEKTKAKFSEGVLEITIPRTEEATGRRIDVQ